jgi:topoisomerase-4 subunit A
LEITYKGAQASRPADIVAAADFIGIKSHRAKGKRLSTYDVDQLNFVEPEEVIKEEPTEGPQPIVAESAPSMTQSAMDDDGVEFEIVRNAPDETSEQLNLF